MNYEDVLRQVIFPELEKGRPNWDKPHTESVVEHIKAIIDNNQELNLDRDVLVIAAYAHDWGYAGLFAGGKPLSFDEITDAKVAHMKIGAEKLAKLLASKAFDFLTEAQKQRAVFLVQYHDDLTAQNDIDQKILLEADTLGGLDVDKTKPSFDKASNDKYMESTRRIRLPLFATEYSKMMFEKLYRQREEYYENGEN